MVKTTSTLNFVILRFHNIIRTQSIENYQKRNHFFTLGEGFIRKLCILCTKRIKIFNFTTNKLNFWSLQSQFLVDQFLTKKRVVPPPCACLFPDNLQIYIWTVSLIWTVYVWTVILERCVLFEKSCVITLTLSCLFRVPGMQFKTSVNRS